MLSIKRYIRYCALGILLAIPAIISCNWEKKEVIPPPHIPFPDLLMAKWLQVQVDSSRFTWYLDPKGTASSFCNEELFLDKQVSTNDVIITGEGLFHARLEVALTDSTLILDLERPFKERGENSIWQVVKLVRKK